ncbi:MAG: DUF4870 family protein [Vibrio sp.]
MNNDFYTPSNQYDTVRTHTIISYILFAIGLFSGGLFTLIGVIWAYVKREDASQTIYYSHFDNVISTFWISLVLTIVSFLLWVFGIGIFLFVALYIFNIYRITKGLIRAIDHKPYL